MNFFRKNLLIIFSPALLLVSITVFYILHQPTVFMRTLYVESKLEIANLQNQITMTEQIVGNLRSTNVQKQLGLGEVNLVVYKVAPLSLNISVTALQKEKLNQAEVILLPYLKEKYQAEKVGIGIDEIKKTRIIFPAVVSIGVGLICGIILALIRTYLKKY